jgi:hypothetical protein
MTNTPFLLFMHIPKNAGTTFRSIVDCQYGKKAVLTYYNQPNTQLLDNLPYMLVRPNPPRALIGHFHFGPHRGMPQSPRYLVLLRDPVRRVVSEYKERATTTATRAELTKADGSLMSLDEALETYPEHYANQQVRYVAGIRPGVEAIAADLDAALANIDQHFAFAGTVERFDESMLLMGRILGWQPFVYDRMNTRPAPLDYSAPTLARLRSLTALDQVLYDKVASRLDATIAEAGEPLSSAMQELHRVLDAFQSTQDGRPRDAVRAPDDLPAVAAFLSAAPSGAL